MKKRLFIVILPIITLIVELLPYGAVCNFMAAGGKVVRNTYSYFDLVPFGYANFAPLITGIITCLILILSITYVLKGNKTLAKTIKNILFAAIAISFGPLLFGINYFSIVACIISATLIGELVLVYLLYLK